MLQLLKQYKKLELALALALLFSCAASVAGFAVKSEQLRGNVLRLHVLAHSDSQADQELKLQVRDAVLQAGAGLFDGETTVETAQERLETQLDTLTLAARNVIEKNGKDYPVDIYVAKEYFATRSYGDITLPAGDYTALKVIIGAGEGKNWWCIMFPPLCLPAAQQEDGGYDAYFDENGYDIAEHNPRFEPRFKVVEWYEQLRERLG